jgi:hypothetical protein
MPKSLKGWLWAIGISVLVIAFVFRVGTARTFVTGIA